MEFLLPYIQKYPTLMSVLIIVGGLRLIFKPLMGLIQTYVDYTPSQSDNEFLKKIMESFIYKKLVWVIDYLGSIKLPK